MLVVQPKPKRNWYRYSSEQMSGPLPRTLYKYLPGRHAATMIDRGELMFSTLAWFQNYEDDQRGDRFEGPRKYFPVGGLDVTRTERAEKPHPPVSFKAPTESLQSRATGTTTSSFTRHRCRADSRSTEPMHASRSTTL